MTDYKALKALCAELHAAFNTYAVDMAHHDLLERARAALAEPEPPADGEVAELVNHLLKVAAEDESDGCTYDSALIRRAAELLERLVPQPEPEGPADDDIEALHHAVFFSRLQGPSPNTSCEVDLVRAALDRWGQS